MLGMDSFAEVVENTRNLSLCQEREVRSVPSSPALPPRCSSKLKMIIERQICLGQSQSEEARSGRSSLNGSPYVSPYGSPCSSPRIKRKPLKVRGRDGRSDSDSSRDATILSLEEWDSFQISIYNQQSC